jgi:hypothetical protein
MIGFKHILAAALIASAGVGALAADAAKDAGTWEKFKAYTHQQKNEAVVEGKKLLAAADKQLAEMKTSTQNSGAEFKAANEKNMKELQDKKKAAQVELDKLEKSNAEAWDATKTGFSSAAKDLGQAYDKAVAAVKK